MAEALILLVGVALAGWLVRRRPPPVRVPARISSAERASIHTEVDALDG